MRVELRNWLCYSSLSVDFQPGVHLLTGPNGSGKSSVLDGVRWCLTGLARSVAKVKDYGQLRGDQSKPVSVSLEMARSFDGWPAAFQRASKFAVVPETLQDAYKARVDYVDAALGTWEFLRRSDGERAAFLNALQRFAFDESALLAEVGRALGGKSPPPGKYNGCDWGGWQAIADAERQAIEIRRSYHAAAQGPGKDLDERIAHIQADLRGLPSGPRPVPPDGVLSPAEHEKQYEGQVRKIARLRGIGSALEDLLSRLAGDSFASARDVVAAYRAETVDSQLAREQQVVDDLHRASEGGRAAWERHTAAADLWDKQEAQRSRWSGALLSLEQARAAAVTAKNGAEARRKSWDTVANALAADGPVAAALSSRATRALDRERLAWASEVLGVKVGVGADGAIQVSGRSPGLPSRGEQMLAALAVQDAACGLAGVPLLLVDELECLDAVSFGRAMEFLSAAAEDYEAVLCCYTGELPVSVPSGVWVWLAAGGKLHRC